MLAILRKDDKIINAVIEDDKICELTVSSIDSYMRVGSIYIGKVKNVVKNLESAFVEFSDGEQGFFNLKKDNPIILNNKSEKQVLSAEDEILVQIKREKKGKKPVTLTSKIELKTSNVVMILGKSGVNVSKKIKDLSEKERIKEILENAVEEGFCLIARTDCEGRSKEEIIKEVNILKTKREELLKKAKTRSVFSVLKKPVKSYLSGIFMYGRNISDKIIINDKEIYEEANLYKLNAYTELQNEIVYWDEEKNGDMDVIYRISTVLKGALNKNVWLKHGGFLVIEPTEALTVIDVNSGGDIKKKKKSSENFFRINMEAAKEILRQIRLRNLSGIIIIDFIDMEDKEKIDKLIVFLKKECLKDTISCNVVDITKLGLVEITRKRVLPPLSEQFYSNPDI